MVTNSDVHYGFYYILILYYLFQCVGCYDFIQFVLLSHTWGPLLWTIIRYELYMVCLFLSVKKASRGLEEKQ